MEKRVTVEVLSMEQGLRVRGIAENGTTLEMDSGEAAVAPNPVEAMIMALGACTALDVIETLRKKRQQVTGYEVVVQGERREEYPRVFTRIEIVHRLRGRDLSPAAIEHAIHLSDTKYCTVHGQLEPSVPITSRYEIIPEPGA